MRMKKYLLTQNGQSDCGITAVRTLLAVTHKNEAYLTFQYKGKSDNFLSMQKILSANGVTTSGLNVEHIDQIKTIKKPFILQTRRGNLNHFVVCQLIKKKIEINDPCGENYLLPLKDYQKYLISNILVVDCVDATDKPLKLKLNIPRLPTLFSILFVVSLCIGFYFINNPRLDLISYIALILATLFKIIEEHSLMNSFLKFDKEYVSSKITTLDGNFKSEFSKLQNAKTVVFSFKFKILSHFIAVLLIAILFSLNNLLFLVLALTIFAIAFVELRGTKSNDKKRFALEETYIELEKNNAKTSDKYNLLIEKTTDLAKTNRFFAIIIYFWIALTTFLLMYFTTTYSLNFFIFMFFGFSYFYSEAKKLLNLVTNKANYYQAINKLIN